MNECRYCDINYRIMASLYYYSSNDAFSASAAASFPIGVEVVVGTGGAVGFRVGEGDLDGLADGFTDLATTEVGTLLRQRVGSAEGLSVGHVDLDMDGRIVGMVVGVVVGARCVLVGRRDDGRLVG